MNAAKKPPSGEEFNADEGDIKDFEVEDFGTDEAVESDVEKSAVQPSKEAKEEEDRLEEERLARQAAEGRILLLEERLRRMDAESAQHRQAQQEYQATSEEDQIQAKLTAARARRKQALQEADGDVFDEADVEIRALDRQLEGVRAKLTAAKAPREQPAAPQPQPTAAPKRAVDWTTRQAAWFGKPGFEAESHLANGVYLALQAEGLSPEDEGFYDELNQRLASSSKRLGFLGKQAQPQTGPRSATVGSSKGADTAAKPTPNRLTQDDLKMMAQVGMDPANPKHRAAWLKRNAPL